MTTSKRPPSNDLIYRRIDEMPMSVADRERAKASLQSGERFADAVCELSAAIRSGTAYVARLVRTALTPSPQH